MSLQENQKPSIESQVMLYIASFEWVFIVTKQKHTLAVFILNTYTNKNLRMGTHIWGHINTFT